MNVVNTRRKYFFSATCCAAAAAIAALAPQHAAAQAVYKCRNGSYSDQACSPRVVRTYESPAPHAPRAREGVSRRLPGETVAEFNVRQRRAHLRETDRDECARLDTRMAVDQQRAKALNEEEVDAAQSALDTSRRRARQLGC